MCKNITGELHKERFGSGIRGRCIRYNAKWYTPNEFAAICGKSSSKDWKRSIKVCGGRIQALINNGLLVLHSCSCICATCCADQTCNRGSTMSPVLLFTPYKRKKHIPEPNENKPKIETVTSPADSDMSTIHQTNNDSNSKEAWQTMAEKLDNNPEYPVKEDPNANTDPLDMVEVLKRLGNVSQTLVMLTEQMKQCVEEVRMISFNQIQQLEGETASSALIAANMEPVDGSLPNVDVASTKVCANCNHKALSECSLCRRTPYCSTFCQTKDWGSHQIECLQSVSAVPTDQNQSVKLIVESQHL